MAAVSIRRVDALPNDFRVLVEASVAEGLTFVVRMRDAWVAGTNRFDRTGEAAFVARRAGRLVGICGLNIDPYLADSRVGRVRHLYVVPAARRRGVGRQLVSAVLAHARPGAVGDGFRRVRLRTKDDAANQFYLAIGFDRMLGEPEATHVYVP